MSTKVQSSIPEPANTVSLSGKTSIDWHAFAKELEPVEVITNPTLIKKRSRDFFWYSPILNEELKKCFGDLVALPKTKDELKHCLELAYNHEVPIVLRGGGTGNYGQAVPVNGGLIIQTTAMNKVLEIGNGWVRVEAGMLIAELNEALKATGQELAMFPSTQEIATIGGFVAGGSMGIGSLATGPLREPGNLISLKAFSVEKTSKEHTFEDSDVLKIHHAWGLNGVISEVTLRTVLTEEWVGCFATFTGYEQAYAAAYELAISEAISPKLLSVVDRRIVTYFPELKGHVREGFDLIVGYLPKRDVEAFQKLVVQLGGHLDLSLSAAESEASNFPHAFEFCYNHTTLQVLKSDRRATYQQVGVPNSSDAIAIGRLHEALGDDVWMHHEFARLGGKVISIDIPIIWYSGEGRLAEINQTYEAHGFTVYDAHVNQVEGGGLHNANYSHLAWKKRLDPKGLLNSAKSAAWDKVKDLTPEEIEAKAVEDTSP